ncbi:MAG: hypothetical protein HY901_21035 [Deltaproteobacteria bacterium]|nr:hypothetical protein [Deltaproteobacteria bacterium]
MAETNAEQARQSLSVLNAYFRARTLCGQVLYDQLAVLGLDADASVMIDLHSQTEEAYSGLLIGSNGRVYEFSVDLVHAERSTWKDVTESATAECQRLGEREPSARLVVAFEAFEQIRVAERGTARTG